MSRKRVGGTLSAAAMKALSALCRADIVDVIGARPDRPVDRIADVLEARRLIAAGATVEDIAGALGVTTAAVSVLIGPANGRDPATATRKGP